MIHSGFERNSFQRCYPHSDNERHPPLLKVSRHFNLSVSSILGLDLNPTFGSWFGIRALFLFKETLPEIRPEPFENPCEKCSLRPCLSHCSGDAFKDSHFNAEECGAYRLKENSLCEKKCDARLACPVGKEEAYSKEQMDYHYSHGLKMLKEIREKSSS